MTKFKIYLDLMINHNLLDLSLKDMPYFISFISNLKSLEKLFVMKMLIQLPVDNTCMTLTAAAMCYNGCCCCCCCCYCCCCCCCYCCCCFCCYSCCCHQFHHCLPFSYPALKNEFLSTDLMACSCFPTMPNNGACGSVIFYHVYNSYILI